ncbi:MAG: preprotein translocase subunit SecE [Clostridia bacterium]|nr:preprotein translocase subunit SecE [Clostridia bacterium]
MAKNKNKLPASSEMEKSDEVLSVKQKPSKEEIKAAKKAEKEKAQKQNAKKQREKVKRNRAKETVSELKKVSWPTFGKAAKQTGAVLVVVAIFTLVVLGIDTLLAWLLKLIINI